MKKISCFLLAVIIILSLMTTAFAAPANINAGDTKSVTLGLNQSETYKFKAEETGIYAVELTAKNEGFIRCEICNASNTNGVICSGSTFLNSGCPLAFPAEKGSEFLIVLKECSGSDPDHPDDRGFDLPAKAVFTLKKSNAPFLKLNSKYSVNDFHAYFAFIPSESGYYNFRSSTNEKFSDPDIKVVDDMNNYKFNSDNGYRQENGRRDRNFDLSIYCKAGTIYLAAIHTSLTLTSEDNPAEYPDNPACTFTLKRAEGIKPELLVPVNSAVTMARRGEYFDHVDIAPSGSDINVDYKDITVTSSNPAVADVASYELSGNDILLEINSFRLGKTTITVKLSNGVSTDISVKVKPKIIIWLEDLFDMLFGR